MLVAPDVMISALVLPGVDGQPHYDGEEEPFYKSVAEAVDAWRLTVHHHHRGIASSDHVRAYSPVTRSAQNYATL
jgi:hypothetical protein